MRGGGGTDVSPPFIGKGKCKHNYDRFLCGACCDEKNHGTSAKRESATAADYRTYRITAWRKAKAIRKAKETEYARRYLGG